VTEHEGPTPAIPKITIRHELKQVHYHQRNSISIIINLERIQRKFVTSCHYRYFHHVQYSKAYANVFRVPSRKLILETFRSSRNVGSSHLSCPSAECSLAANAVRGDTDIFRNHFH
jgi:hypothetical protein